MKGTGARVFKLRNGLTVVVETDRAAPLVAVSVTYKVGSVDEERGRAGFAHLFEHLMFQGTANLPPNEISRLVETSGGVDNAYTMKTNTTYHEVVPSWAVESVLWAEADRMGGLLISERELEVEKQVVLEEMRQSYFNQPYRRATDAVMGELAFQRWESSHGTIGDPADLRAADLADVRAFYERHYAPNNAVLALVGDIGVADARRLVTRHFGPLKRRSLLPRRRLDEKRPAAPRTASVSDPLAKTPLTVVGWHAPERGTRDYWALTLLAAILGGGEDSPLHQALVKESRLALSAGGHMPYWSSHVNARGPDLIAFFISGRLGTGADVVVAELEKVLARFRRSGPTAGELERAKVQLERTWVEGQLSLMDRAQTLSSYVAFVGAPAGYWRDLKKALGLTPRAVALAARRWIRPTARLVLQVDPGAPVPVAEEPESPEPPPEELRPPGVPPPPPGPAKRAVPPDLRLVTLRNGLDLWIARDERLPYAEFRMAVRAGRAHESEGERGLSQACEELMLKGARGRDAAEIARALAAKGWSLGASCEAEWLKLSASGLSRGYRDFTRELAAILVGADFPEAETALWRENAVEELLARRAQPSFLSEERLRAELFAGHPYSRGPADENAIGAVTSDRLRAFHAARVRPAGGHAVLIGDLDPDAAARELEDALAAWPGGAAPAEFPAIPEHGRARLAFVPRPGSAQASLILAQSTPARPGDPDYLALMLANHALGGTANSRLFENLRTRRGYTYGSYSSLEAYGRGSVWTASADTRPEVARPALDEMRLEAARVRDELIPVSALENSKRHLSGLFLMRLAAMDRVAGYAAAIVESGRDPRETAARYQERLAAVTPEDARAAFRARLDPEKFVAVVVADPSVEKSL